MKTNLVLITLALCVLTVNGQWYNVTFRGTSYGLDPSGNIAPTPLTEQSLVEAAAEYRGIPTNNLALIYHLESGGDSLKVVDKTTGQQHHRMFLFTYGADIGRTNVSNTAGTELRAIEYVYTLDNTRFTSWNSHSMGAVFLTKRTLSDTNGNLRHSIDGTHMQWCVLPQSGRSSQSCVGSFQTGTAFTPQP